MSAARKQIHAKSMQNHDCIMTASLTMPSEACLHKHPALCARGRAHDVSLPL